MNFRHFFVYPHYPENLRRLYELAYNLWSVWNHDAISLFYRIDGELFERVNRNPIRLLHSLSKERLDALSKDRGFLFEFEKVWEDFQRYLGYRGAYKEQCTGELSIEQNDVIAYFSMEYGLHECIPIYAGGLGILSGDFLKAASDLDLPVVGVGLLYRCGYFTQYIDPSGYQREVCEVFDNHLIPVRELHGPEGKWAHVDTKILNENVKVKLWKIDVGKSKLVLLDTDISGNTPAMRDITGELYVGDREKRIQQELLIGLAGVQALSFLGIEPRIYHFNEGHSAFAVVGRLRQLMAEKKFTFSQAKAVIRASTVFTTHTPVIAGNEHFDTELVKKYLQPELEAIGLTVDQVMCHGLIEANAKVFWMPAFAMRFSRHINAVSNQHTQTSRKMWSGLFSEQPAAGIPIVSITNGVHNSWVSPPFAGLFNRYLGPDYIHCGKNENVWKKIYDIPDEELWSEHRRNKRDMVNIIRRRLWEQTAEMRYSPARMPGTKRPLSADYLTIVFARRFASYKRPTLILRDKERLRKILTDPNKPVQIIFAGKAHPADEQSKKMIKEVIDFARDYQVQDRMLFLQNFDMNMARHICCGADVWLNNPAPDMEASGTSGMKAAMNGVLHLSTFEGWWPEGYTGNNGWVITAGRSYQTADLQDDADAGQLYDLLENQITELFYSRNEADVPEVWAGMMKDSIFSVCGNFNMNRVLCDYLTKFYKPAKEESQSLSADNYKLLKDAIREEKTVLESWDKIKLLSLSTNIEEVDHLTEAETIEVECGVQFGGASPELFRVELFYIYDENGNYKIAPMQSSQQKGGTTIYKHSLPITGYGAQSLNVRVIPANRIVQDIHPELVKWKD